ncbi:MAG: hypothetical protein KDA22_11320 [Phycisphaerales bacterium]|nr:hypothetical protein [Phycisphaerales bacterium]
MAQRLLTLLLVIALSGGTGLVPMGAGGSAAPTGERFPCEDCGCGCASAERCWTACCCHSLDERLAWAVRAGVEPPATVLARLAPGRWEQARRLVVAPPACPHCKSADEPAPRPTVNFAAAQRCRGQVSWLVVVAVDRHALQTAPLIPPLEPLRDDRAVLDGRSPTGRSLDPASPPPRPC